MRSSCGVQGADEFNSIVQKVGCRDNGTMAGKTFEIQVQDDHLQRIAQVRKPIHAIADLIWNAVDADADVVDVTLHDDQLGALHSIDVADDGHGILYAEAEELFSRLGGSWKQGKHQSREKRRLLHGKDGRGRFRAFALGRVVDWNICYRTEGNKLRSYRITMVKDHLKQVKIDEETPARADQHRGVTVKVSELDRDFRSLRDAGVVDELAQIFALYLRQYPEVRISYSGTLIDPHSVEEHVESYTLPAIATGDGESFDTSLEIVEWKMITERRMYFCDAQGFPLGDTPPGIHGPGFNFTAYLKSELFCKVIGAESSGDSNSRRPNKQGS
jgi:hypothetical protein